MILDPGIIALSAGSVLESLMILAACWFSLQITMQWNPADGSERQLELEKRTCLVSTFLVYTFGIEILSFFLFIYTADHLHRLFIGAMCAAGTLNCNPYGYPALAFKAAVFILAGIWLVMNHADLEAKDYPLIRIKYAFILLLTPFVLAGAYLQWSFFLHLKEGAITSCCGSLFGAGIANDQGPLALIAGIPTGPFRILFYGSAFLFLGMGILYRYGFHRIGSLFSLSSVAFFLMSVIAFMSFFCLYFYQQPTHHCPFCILQEDYHYIGYLLYGTLLGGVISGSGVGILMPFRKISSLENTLPGFQGRLVTISAALAFAFVALVTWQMIRSDFMLGR